MTIDNLTEQRFLDKIKINPETGCWEWQAGLFQSGYGVFTYYGKAWKAHRFSYRLFHGEIKKENLVCHTCDNRKCVSPDHVFQDTPARNQQDRKNRTGYKTGWQQERWNYTTAHLEPEDRFWSRCDKDPVTGCWIWNGGTFDDRYGAFRYEGKQWRANRLSVYLTNGKQLRKEDIVCHKCSNSLCISPVHLYIGTQKDNMQDRAKNGYQPERRDECKNGHKLVEGNLYINPHGGRHCLLCKKEKAKEDYEKNGATYSSRTKQKYDSMTPEERKLSRSPRSEETIEKDKERKKKKREENPEYMEKYRLEKAEEIKAQRKKHYEENKERLQKESRERQRKLREEYPEEVKEKRRQRWIEKKE